jgi:hypothetical protein
MKVGFFLGAGFSRAIDPHMPLMTEIPGRLQDWDEDLWEEVKSSCPFHDNVELCMDYLSQSQPWLDRADNTRNRALYFKLVDWFANHINDIQKEAFETYRNKLKNTALNRSVIKAEVETTWIEDLIEYWLSTHPTVVTLNYDLLVEAFIGYPSVRSWAENRLYTQCYPVKFPPVFSPEWITTNAIAFNAIEIPDAERKFDYIKLHGSVNWVYDYDESNEQSVMSVNDAGLGIFEKSEVGEDKKIKLARQRVQEDQLAGKKPLIIPPTFQKGSFLGQAPIRYLWQRASKDLSECDRIYFVGYSLPETDLTIRHMLNASVLNSKTEIVLVTLDVEAVDHYMRLLPFGKYDHGLHLFGENAVSRLLDQLKEQQGKCPK